MRFSGCDQRPGVGSAVLAQRFQPENQCRITSRNTVTDGLVPTT